MAIKQNLRTLDEVCIEGKVNEYRDIIQQIFELINKNGCRITTQYRYPASSLDWSTPDAPTIRLNLHSNDEPLHIIWALIHEYGHFLSGKPSQVRLDGRQKMDREILAWDLAEQVLLQFPALHDQNASYLAYKAVCLKTYEDGLQFPADQR